MNLDYNTLKKNYVDLFENNDKCDFVLTDVLFTFSEIYSIVNNNQVNKILEIGSGTGILLNELSKIFKDKFFYGLDPHQKGFVNYEKISKKISNNNLSIIHSEFEKFDHKEKFDLIFSFNVFEHLEDQIMYIKKIDKFLSKGGKSVILCPNYDFPYEPHFVIPIIYSKDFTYSIFKKKIIKHEEKTGEKGLWKGLNFCSKKRIEKYLLSFNYQYHFDADIKDRLLQRLDNDQSSYFKKRQGIVAKLTSIAKKIKLDKFIFNFLKIPFPYMKIIIKKNK
jgi:SAM-dependent methyltransferase